MPTSPPHTQAFTSTPMKVTSRTIVTPDNPTSAPSDRRQKELIGILRGEIGRQTWQFKDARRISRILSPKRHIPGRSRDDIDGFDCTVDGPKFTTAFKEAARQLEREQWARGAYHKEKDSYDDIVKFLNSCVKAGAKALSDEALQGTWYQNLTFVKYDKVMGDGVGDAPPLKPDIGGVNDKKPALTLYWSPSDGLDKARMQLPVEVKDEWSELIAQAATYGRSLFSANPSRVFALVFGVNHRTKTLRFLLFHRGGLTTHTEFRLDTPEGRAEILRVIMTILLWSEAQHAGFISTSNDLHHLLPVSSESHTKGTVTNVIHHSDCVRGRATRVTRLTCLSPNSGDTSEVPVLPKNLEPSTTTQATVRRSPRLMKNDKAQSPSLSLPMSQPKGSRGSQGSKTDDSESVPIYPHHPRYSLKWSPPSNLNLEEGSISNGQEVILKASWQTGSRKDVEREMFKAASGAFGTPVVFCSYEGSHLDGVPISNRLLLPSPKEVENDPDLHYPLFVKDKDDGTPPLDPEVRTLCYVVFFTAGQSLTEAKSSHELCMALVHGLLGWLSYYQSGFTQRDISIGNVLLAVGNARSKRPFSITGDILSPLWPPLSLDAALHSRMKFKESETSASQIASEIMVLVGQLEIKDTFTAFVTDGDMAVNWKTYFNDERNQIKSGTPEFMSLALHRAMDQDKPYIHSPIDDIQSFFWLAVWAVLFNSRPQRRSQSELIWGQNLRSGDRGGKTDFVDALTLEAKQGHSPIGNELFPFLQDWWERQRKLAMDWHGNVVAEAAKIPEHEVDNIRSFYLHHFHLYALRGVKEFLDLVVRDRETLKACGDQGLW
ncbi:hypothetical protein GGX14DRAFT_649174 [Mycena pura]|uniref:Fungal-type protein kinase domain-containing protein n=1 Tax=Mycena pura TaxID=153505 RepID=A0AAD6YMW1_9AGAR|nr:hypothetical protein GGX14DRAFT_649174 [Mycena pura]